MSKFLLKTAMTSAAVSTVASVAFFAAAVQAAEVAPQDVVYDLENYEIANPLTDQPGDAAAGRTIATNRKKGNCLACHVMPIDEQSFHGETGPTLWGVGETYSEAELRLRVANYRKLNPEVMMPGFYRDPAELVRPRKQFAGKTILTAQEVEDVVAYLTTLKTYQD